MSTIISKVIDIGMRMLAPRELVAILREYDYIKSGGDGWIEYEIDNSRNTP